MIELFTDQGDQDSSAKKWKKISLQRPVGGPPKNTHLFTSAVHNLIIRPSIYFPITGFRGMLFHKIAGHINIYVSTLGI